MANTIKKFTKEPEEKYEILVNHSNRLPRDTVIESAEVTATDVDGNDITSTVILSDSTRITDDGNTIGVVVQGGTDGQRAKLKFKATCDDDNQSIIVTKIVMMIEEE